MRFMKPARLVDVATSGAVVTRYGATVSMRESSTSTLPKASCVDTGRAGGFRIVAAGI